MSIDIREVSFGSEEYDNLVTSSPQATVFHQSGFMEVLSEHSDMELKVLAGFKGEEAVGIFPLFIDEKWNVDRVYSPPSSFGVPYLGPILLNFQKLKRRKSEKRYKRFITSCIQWVGERINPKHAMFRLSVEQCDSRPFQWTDFQSTPKYTYLVNLDVGVEGLKKAFTGELRRQVRRYSNSELDHTVEISVEHRGGVKFVYNQIESRYKSQGRSYPISYSFLKDVHAKLADDRVKLYTGRVDGELVAGILVLQDGETSYFWQGGGKPDASVPINDLLHWEIVKDSVESGKSYYDLCGANTERLCEYKAKFNPSLRTYYEVELDSPISKLYKMIQ